MSSLSYGEFLNGTGILDSSSLKSPLWFANKVYIAYCSSDAFMGNINENETVWGWYFQGQQIVYETIRILRDKFGLDHNSKVVLSGSSAGARGLMVLYENLVENHLPKGIDVFAFLDSPYYIDVVPYTSSFRGFLYETSQVYVNYNVSLDILGVDCKAHYSKEPWKCLFGQYRMPYITLPYFLMLSTYDSYQLSRNIGQDPPYVNQSAYDFAETFAALTTAHIANLMSARERPPNDSRPTPPAPASNELRPYAEPLFGYFMWSCYSHAQSATEQFYLSSTESGVTPSKALGLYLSRLSNSYAPPGAATAALGEEIVALNSSIISWIDLCVGFGCGGGCVSKVVVGDERARGWTYLWSLVSVAALMTVILLVYIVYSMSGFGEIRRMRGRVAYKGLSLGIR